MFRQAQHEVLILSLSKDEDRLVGLNPRPRICRGAGITPRRWPGRRGGRRRWRRRARGTGSRQSRPCRGPGALNRCRRRQPAVVEPPGRVAPPAAGPTPPPPARYTVNRANLLALWQIKMPDAFRTQSRIDFINLFALVDRIIRANWFANITVDAFVRYLERHVILDFNFRAGSTMKIRYCVCI